MQIMYSLRSLTRILFVFFFLKDAVAWCLGNMCSDSPELCDEMSVLDVEAHLHERLGSHVCRIFRSVAYALTHYYATVPKQLR